MNEPLSPSVPSPSGHQERLRQVTLYGGLLIVVLGGVLVSHLSSYLVDGAFLLFRYAEKIAQGAGPVFNAHGPRVEGFSSPLWVAALAVLFKVGGPDRIAPAALLLGVASYSACLAVLLRAGRLADERSFAGSAVARLLPALLWCLSTGALFYAVSGLETSAFVFVLLAVHASAADGVPRTLGLAAAVLAAAVRPEAAVLVVALGAQLWAEGSSAQHRHRVQALILAVLAGCAAVVVVRWLVFHAWLPNTFQAKRPSLEAGLGALMRALRSPSLVLILVAGVAGAVVGEKRHRGYAAAALVWLVSGVLEGGDWMPAARCFQPALALSALAAAGLGRAVAASGRNRAPLVAVAAVALVIPIDSALALGRPDFGTDGPLLPHVDQAAFVRWFLDGGLRSVALVDAGEAGFLIRQERVVDLTGVTEPIIGDAPGGLLDKHMNWDDLFAKVLPDVIVIRVRKMPPRDSSGHLQPVADDVMSNVERSLMTNPRVAKDYHLAFVDVPSATRTPLFARLIYLCNRVYLPPDVPMNFDVLSEAATR